MKDCVKCNQNLPLTEFYAYKTKAGPMPCGECRKCHNANVYVKKGTGFSRLSNDQQERIINSIKNRRNKLKDIADEEGIPYANLCYWLRKNLIPT